MLKFIRLTAGTIATFVPFLANNIALGQTLIKALPYSTASNPDDNVPFCYMHTAANQTLDLTRICGGNGAANTSSPEFGSYSGSNFSNSTGSGVPGGSVPDNFMRPLGGAKYRGKVPNFLYK